MEEDSSISPFEGLYRKSGGYRQSIDMSRRGDRSGRGDKSGRGDRSGRGGQRTAGKFGFGSTFTPAPPPGAATGRPTGSRFGGSKQRRNSLLTAVDIFSTEDAEDISPRKMGRETAEMSQEAAGGPSPVPRRFNAKGSEVHGGQPLSPDPRFAGGISSPKVPKDESSAGPFQLTPPKARSMTSIGMVPDSPVAELNTPMRAATSLAGPSPPPLARRGSMIRTEGQSNWRDAVRGTMARRGSGLSQAAVEAALKAADDAGIAFKRNLPGWDPGQLDEVNGDEDDGDDAFQKGFARSKSTFEVETSSGSKAGDWKNIIAGSVVTLRRSSTLKQDAHADRG